MLATAAYIDLNPVAAGIAPTPEASEHTSLRTRLDHCREQGTVATLRAGLSTETRNPAQEADGWLMPVDDVRAPFVPRAGMLPGFTLSGYFGLVDWTSRLLRDGKAHVPAEVAPIFERIQVDPSTWQTTLSDMFARSKHTGCHFGRPERLAEAAQAHGRRWHRNQLPRPSRAAALAG